MYKINKFRWEFSFIVRAKLITWPGEEKLPSVNENHNSQFFVPSTFYISLFYKLKNNWSNYPCLLCWTFYIFYPNYTLCVYFLFFILLCWTAELYLNISGLFKSSRFWINIFENQEYFVFKKTRKEIIIKMCVLKKWDE